MIKSERHIAFLLGAGFSVPAGMPTAKTLNESLVAHIFNAIRNSFKEGEDLTIIEYVFEKVLIDSDECGCFNYELYFDCLEKERGKDLDINRLVSFVERGMYGYFWKCSMNDDEEAKMRKNNITNIVKSIKEKCYQYSDAIEDVERKYQFWIADSLTEHTQNSKTKSVNTSYKGFVDILAHYVGQGYIVDIYTLNHDLFLESLLQQKKLKDKVSNGFGGKSKLIKKKAYTTFDKKFFNKQIRIYKLHGSINMHELFYFNKKDKKYIQITDGYSCENAFLMDDNKGASIIPLFLTGKNTKTQKYEKEPFFTMFNLMKDNLKITEKLIVVGYSGNDEGINNILFEKYSNWDNAFVVAPSAKYHLFVQQKQAHPLNQGVESLKIEQIIR